MARIEKLTAREILDSRGMPTVEALCVLEGGFSAKASVPSGASTGSHEAVELRDNDKKRYGGAGTLLATANVNGEIFKALAGKDFHQTSLDRTLIELDGTKNKARLGANAILAVSLAFARAEAKEEGVELFEHLGSLAHNSRFTMPQPMFNVINGGKHADSGLDIQEFMIAPIAFPLFREKVRVGAEIIQVLKRILKGKNYAVSVGDEGGFAPKLSSNEMAFDFLIQAIKDAGYSTDSVKIGIDVSASSFYKNGLYTLTVGGQEKNMSPEQMIEWYEKLVGLYPIISIEDGLSEEDWTGFAKLSEKLGEKRLIVGDDLTVTNSGRIEIAIEKKAVNAVIIKPNQIGTLTETLQAIALTKKQGLEAFISHRSGETEDAFIADLAVGLACPYIKAGSLVRGERVAKYNRLMEIDSTKTLA